MALAARDQPAVDRGGDHAGDRRARTRARPRTERRPRRRASPRGREHHHVVDDLHRRDAERVRGQRDRTTAASQARAQQRQAGQRVPNRNASATASPTVPQSEKPRAVPRTIPSTSPIAQPVRQCSVALNATPSSARPEVGTLVVMVVVRVCGGIHEIYGVGVSENTQ